MLILDVCGMPDVVTNILSQIYRIIIIAIPIGMVIFGSIDFVKAIAAKDDNAIATGTKTLISRLIAGALTFFVLTLVSWIFTIIGRSIGDANSAMDCAIQIIGGAGSSGSGSSDFIKDTVDTTTNIAKCQNDCNSYCGNKTNSYNFIQACSTYCSGGQKFNSYNAPCN